MEKLIKEFQIIKENNIPVIVEGKKDKLALQELGINNIIMLDKAIYKIIEDVKEKEVVILTDLDKEGRKLYSILNNEFSRRGVRINNRARKKLFENKISYIESLTKVLNIQ